MQIDDDYIFVIPAIRPLQMYVFKKIDTDSLFDMTMLFHIPALTEDVDSSTILNRPVSFTLHYNQSGKMLTPHHLVLLWDNGLLTSTVYGADNFSEIV